MQIETRKIEDLIPADYNPRIQLNPNMDEYKRLKKSLETYGLTTPLIWNKRTGVLVGGHQRLTVLKDLGYTEVQVSVVDLDDAKEKALNIALNKIESTWEEEKLKDLLEELWESETIDETLTGYETEEIRDLLSTYDKEDILQDIEEGMLPDFEEEKVKHGEVYQLGKNKAFVGEFPEGKSFDLIIMEDPTEKEVEQAFEMLKTGGAYYILHEDKDGMDQRRYVKQTGAKLAQTLLWEHEEKKGSGHFNQAHTPILYGWKEGVAHYWNADRKQTTHIDMTKTQLYSFLIANSTKKRWDVLAVNASGDALIAGDIQKRNITTVSDEETAEKAIKRWESFTKRTRERI